MGKIVKIGPQEASDLVSKRKVLSPMMKEISSRRHHCDLAFFCEDGGIVLAHKFYMAAASKFLK